MIAKILFVEDDLTMQQYVKEFLREQGMSVHTESHGTKAIDLLEKENPDLLLLDLSLPDVNGESICAQARKKFPTLPIIIVTGKDTLSDKVNGLESGADDYITKPFATEELLARIKTLLRRSRGDSNKLTVGDLELDSQTVTVTRAGNHISLTPQEFKLLEYLMNNSGIVLSRDTILNRIWLYDPDVESRVVDVYIGYLRKKIDHGYPVKLIHSVRGFGYTIKATSPR